MSDIQPSSDDPRNMWPKTIENLLRDGDRYRGEIRALTQRVEELEGMLAAAHSAIEENAKSVFSLERDRLKARVEELEADIRCARAFIFNLTNPEPPLCKTLDEQIQLLECTLTDTPGWAPREE